MLRLALGFLAIFVPTQVVLGDLHGLNTLKYQPVKLAAMEGLWESGRGVSASIVGWPDEQTERNLNELAIPGLGSLYLTHSWNGEVQGLKAFPPDQRPPVAIVYVAFRVMVGVAMLMLVIVGLGLGLLWRRRLEGSGWYLMLCQLAAPLGFIAVIAGWTTTEVGRQPWVVYGVLRTADAVTPSLTGTDVAISMALYVLVYLLIYPTGVAFMARIVREGPGPADQPAVAAGRPRAPTQAMPAPEGV